jgi:HPt (histidine-containing phosphotransfer) domain-containing protein
VGDPELLRMLATEADRRSPTIIAGLEALATSGEKDSDRIEELRIEAHGLKGAALVVGQERLADLARKIEEFLAGSVKSGRIKPGPAAAVIAAASAFDEGAHAAAEGVGEPSAVGDSLRALD